MQPKEYEGFSDRESTNGTLMIREEYDWTDPYCPRCGSGKIFMLIVRLDPVRELTPEDLAQAMAAGVVVEDGHYFLQRRICCRECNTTTKFTEPAESPWAHRPN